MTSDGTILVAVEKPEPDVVVVRVAGTLDRTTSTRLLRVVEMQVHVPGLIRRVRPRRVLVDLASVSRVDAHGLCALRRAESLARRGGVRLQVTGLADRRDVLPGEVVEVLDALDACASLEDALAAALPVGSLREVGIVVAGSGVPAGDVGRAVAAEEPDPELAPAS
ncbi:STAS domain-containing protein [Pseudonocardia benzenivorans]|uniref:Sulfate transporter/antisigma-factor antagonist STAS n=2 Tax=Pseudonocardia TaxID=1847 RepID=F4CZZ7_PSEUX|nr:STAS domain-containing protein [Pseudonocardia dioxanivorans]AEA24830.1 Sulfate transporter/antisigma-factor antagonist STAS [Pseudonocardia dioxanivorans CB1190]GJF02725.1 hypothetical protein PSD17_16870 [Pseudonocardia sp. D17]